MSATTTIAILGAVIALAGWGVTFFLLRRCRAASAVKVGAGKRRLDEELRHARDERDRLLDALGDAFLLVDAGSHIRFANSAARRLFSPRELTGRRVGDIFLDPRLAKGLLHCIATGEPVENLVVLPQQTSPLGDRETRGSNAWLLDAARVPAADGGPPSTRVILRDMTAEHQTEQIRKDFVANASHELRTPLVIISGYLENLLDDNVLEEPELARRFLTVMRKHAERISRLVDDMLLISRLESGEANQLKIEPFPFRACIDDILERLESVIRSQDASVEIIMPDEPTVLHGDQFYWTQILFNLVENALKQNPHPHLRVTVGCELTPGAIRIWVADNGIGIPCADLPHIFRRFYRVEKHHSQTQIKGTGLGLSIVKRAVEAHGGTIAVTSTPGRETRFLITVPQVADGA